MEYEGRRAWTGVDKVRGGQNYEGVGKVKITISVWRKWSCVCGELYGATAHNSGLNGTLALKSTIKNTNAQGSKPTAITPRYTKALDRINIMECCGHIMWNG